MAAKAQRSPFRFRSRCRSHDRFDAPHLAPRPPAGVAGRDNCPGHRRRGLRLLHGRRQRQRGGARRQPVGPEWVHRGFDREHHGAALVDRAGQRDELHALAVAGQRRRLLRNADIRNNELHCDRAYRRDRVHVDAHRGLPQLVERLGANRHHDRYRRWSATKLVFTQPPSSSTGGVAFATQPKVTVQDAAGNTVTTDSSTVTLSITALTPTSGGPGTLPGCTRPSAGVISFSGCKIDTAGTGYKLHAVDGALTPADSSTFNVTVGTATRLASPSRRRARPAALRSPRSRR